MPPNGMINHTGGLYNTSVACPCIAAPAWPSCMRPQLTCLTIPEISRTLLEFYFIIIYFNNFKLSTRVVLMFNQAIFFLFYCWGMQCVYVVQCIIWISLSVLNTWTMALVTFVKITWIYETLIYHHPHLFSMHLHEGHVYTYINIRWMFSTIP